MSPPPVADVLNTAIVVTGVLIVVIVAFAAIGTTIAGRSSRKRARTRYPRAAGESDGAYLYRALGHISTVDYVNERDVRQVVADVLREVRPNGPPGPPHPPPDAGPPR